MTGAARTNEGWQLAENSAEAYERDLVPRFMRPWAERLLELAEVKGGERVLEVGCGTGIVSRRAAARVGASGRVAGLDLNEGMLEVARAAATSIRPAIEWRQGNAAELPYPDGVFDVVLCQQALQFIADRDRALREMHRVLGPGGRVGVSVCRPIRYWPAYAALADALLLHGGPAAGDMVRSIFPPWDRDEFRAIVTAGGFRDVRVLIEVEGKRYPSPEEFLHQEAASSPLAGPISALTTDVRNALIRDLGAALRDHTDDDGVAFPIEIFIATARR